ncbi:MAG: hypothetical protein JRN61_01460 [Nitrososphaerota archaeon]|nr:hypothetical protein [Nitrososphaerota archaeon]
MGSTLKQRFRVPFGYYMEDLLRENFKLRGLFVAGHSRHKIQEWEETYEPNNLDPLLDFYNKITILNILGMSEQGKTILKYHKNKDKELFDNANNLNNFSKYRGKGKKTLPFKLFQISLFVGSNSIELLRIENRRVIVSEVKSQYGPNPDYRIELEFNQLKNLTELTNAGINTSLLYCIALPYPRFVEIRFIKLYNIFNGYAGFNGETFTRERLLRMTIPHVYRNKDNFEYIDNSLYNYQDEKTLLLSVLNRYPFERLQKFKSELS